MVRWIFLLFFSLAFLGCVQTEPLTSASSQLQVSVSPPFPNSVSTPAPSSDAPGAAFEKNTTTTPSQKSIPDAPFVTLAPDGGEKKNATSTPPLSVSETGELNKTPSRPIPEPEELRKKWFAKSDFEMAWRDSIALPPLETNTGDEFYSALSRNPKVHLAKKNQSLRLDVEMKYGGEYSLRSSYFVPFRIANCLGKSPCSVEGVSGEEYLARKERVGFVFSYPYRDLSGNFVFDSDALFFRKYAGASSQNGRNCHLFEISVNRTDLIRQRDALKTQTPLLPLDSEKDHLSAMGLVWFIRSPFRICLDQEGGFLVRREVDLDLFSLFSESKTPVLNGSRTWVRELAYYKESVDDSLFSIPSISTS